MHANIHHTKLWTSTVLGQHLVPYVALCITQLVQSEGPFNSHRIGNRMCLLERLVEGSGS